MSKNKTVKTKDLEDPKEKDKDKDEVVIKVFNWKKLIDKTASTYDAYKTFIPNSDQSVL